MIPDFVEELKVMGLSDNDLDPLWHGAEAYIRAWEAATAWVGNFNTEDNNNLTETCAQLRNQLLTVQGGVTEQAKILDQLKQTGCHGT